MSLLLATKRTKFSQALSADDKGKMGSIVHPRYLNPGVWKSTSEGIPQACGSPRIASGRTNVLRWPTLPPNLDGLKIYPLNYQESKSLL